MIGGARISYPKLFHPSMWVWKTPATRGVTVSLTTPNEKSSTPCFQATAMTWRHRSKTELMSSSTTASLSDISFPTTTPWTQRSAGVNGISRWNIITHSVVNMSYLETVRGGHATRTKNDRQQSCLFYRSTTHVYAGCRIQHHKINGRNI